MLDALVVNPQPLEPSVEWEMLILGAVLVDNSRYWLAAELVRPEYFEDAKLGAAFAKCGLLLAGGNAATPLALGWTKETYPVAFFDVLARETVLIGHVEQAANIVRDCAVRRALKEASRGIVALANDASTSPDSEALLLKADDELRYVVELSDSGKHKVRHVSDTVNSARDLATVAAKRERAVVGTPTGLECLDLMLGGFHPGNLVVLGGRPGMGKTTLALNIAEEAARYFPVIFYSLEMGADELGQRLLASRMGRSADELRRGEVSVGELAASGAYDCEFRKGRSLLYIDDNSSPNTTHLRLNARRLQAVNKGALGLIVVDHLQLVREDLRLERRLEIGRITRSLKAMAKELGCPVLLLSQLSRHNEKREGSNHRPLLSDLRESGDIEQDADLVLFIHREEYYLERARPPRDQDDRYNAWLLRMNDATGRAEIIIAKNRQGPSGRTLDLKFISKRSRFVDSAPHDLPDLTGDLEL